MATPSFILLFFVASSTMMCWIQHSDASSHVSVTTSSKLQQSRHHSRHLLQTLKTCTVDFQTQNYTIITSQCKGPLYPKDACCNSFTEFACPFADAINDNTTDCAITMFNYINIYGRYPSGLFANECVSDSSEGLPCPNVAPAPSKSNAPSTRFGVYPSSFSLLLGAALVSSTVFLFDTSLFFNTRAGWSSP